MQEQKSGPGCGVWLMWGLTVAIILGIVLVCVILAFSTEIRLTGTSG